MPETRSTAASVLVVEDAELIANLLKFLLERERYTVHLAADGRAGLDFIRNREPTSIVLMDVMLPYMDGLELLRELRADPRWRESRVIMLSAKSQGAEIARALDAGADDYLTKPFNQEELFARIRRYRSPPTDASAS